MNIEEIEVMNELRAGVNTLLINHTVPNKIKERYIEVIKKATTMLSRPLCIRCKNEQAAFNDRYQNNYCDNCLNR